MILSKDAFDPDAVFLEDIVDDDVLPYLSLAVDGLTTKGEGAGGKLELRPEDVAANDVMQPSTVFPDAGFDPDPGSDVTIGRRITFFYGGDQ